MKPKVSIIIRARNEERWITPCLKALYSQSFKDFEIILVDNKSTDRTVEKAKLFDVDIIRIDEYRPGNAINKGIAVSQGKYIAILSAHCVPKEATWLQSLVNNLDEDANEEIAGVYGRQEPLSSTTDFDKRDLLITFGLDRRVQIKDSFFHNANSMVRRSVVERIPFDDEVTNVEDRIWAKAVIDQGYKLVYEPRASVYHYHGIHQSADPERARNIVRILESIEDLKSNPVDVNQLGLNITAVITAKGESVPFCDQPLINYTIQRAQESKYLKDVVVSTDNETIKKIALEQNVRVPFVRPARLSRPEVGVEEVLKYTLEQLEDQGNYPDVIVYLSVLQPFRPVGLIDQLIEEFFNKGFDSVLAGNPVYKSCWAEEDNVLKRIDEGFVSSSKKRPIHVGYAGLACVTFSEFVHKGRLLGDNVGICEVLDFYSTIEVKNPGAFELAEKVFPHWWEKQQTVLHANQALGT